MNIVRLSVVPAVPILAFVLIAATVKILREYERAVVFTLGRFQQVKGPGLVLLIPFIQEMVRVDLRIQVIEIPTQDVISHDNVSMKVDAVLYFNVVNPERAIIQVQNYLPGNRGKIPGSRRYQAGWPRQRTRSGSGGTASWPGTARRLPR
jgi:regulator of protease activity HflC (stomatin/prohibitin superfamily)